MSWSLYNVIFLIVGLTMILKAVSHFLRHRKSWRELIVWLTLWGSVVAVALRPNLIDQVAAAAGFRNSLSAVVFPALVIIFYALARLFIKLELIEQKLAELARYLALRKKP